MRAAVKAFIAWLKQKRIRLSCRHIRGEENEVADALSRLSASGNYQLKSGVLAEAERQLGAKAEVDLFATHDNRQTVRYCTVEAIDSTNKNILARDAMTIPWTG